MSVFWDLLQDTRHFDHCARTESLEKRVKRLESELTEMNEIMRKLLYELEARFGEDVDGDGQIGKPKQTMSKLPPKWKPIKIRRSINGKLA